MTTTPTVISDASCVRAFCMLTAVRESPPVAGIEPKNEPIKLEKPSATSSWLGRMR